MACRIYPDERVAGFRSVRMVNDQVSITILPERGGEVHALSYLPKHIDVLWKAPWGLRPQLGNDTQPLWMDGYGGGWQELFPNAGAPCVYKGALLGFHGEASVTEWNCRVEQDKPDLVAVELTARLARSPFVLTRRMIVEDERPAIRIEEQIKNAGEEDLQFMWGHHPAYGAPFLSRHCRLIVPAGEWFRSGASEPESWPGELSIRGDGERHFSHTYLASLREGWYVLYNDRYGFGVRWSWPLAVFPYLHLWQELRGSFGYPWYGNAYVLGVEPFSSMPGAGLNAAIEHGSARTLQAGGEAAVSMIVEFV